jgi:hypothetical protein
VVWRCSGSARTLFREGRHRRRANRLCQVSGWVPAHLRRADDRSQASATAS